MAILGLTASPAGPSATETCPVPASMSRIKTPGFLLGAVSPGLTAGTLKFCCPFLEFLKFLHGPAAFLAAAERIVRGRDRPQDRLWRNRRIRRSTRARHAGGRRGLSFLAGQGELLPCFGRRRPEPHGVFERSHCSVGFTRCDQSPSQPELCSVGIRPQFGSFTEFSDSLHRVSAFLAALPHIARAPRPIRAADEQLAAGSRQQRRTGLSPTPCGPARSVARPIRCGPVPIR